MCEENFLLSTLHRVCESFNGPRGDVMLGGRSKAAARMELLDGVIYIR
jgi:hypothetical protein